MITINIPGSGMSYIPIILRNNIEKLISYVNENFNKKITLATIDSNELIIEINGGLNNSEIKNIEDNFIWIDYLEYNDDSKIVFILS